MRRMLVFAMCVCGMVAAGAGPAEAQLSMGAFRGYLTGYAGVANGGDVADPVSTPGVSVSVQEDDGWGAEFDFGYTSEAVSGLQVLDVATYMFNGNWIQPRGRLRPFALVGAGIVQAEGCDSPCPRRARTYDLGVNAGAGAQLALNDTIGVRGDVRYFRTLADHPDLHRANDLGFWRASIGITFLWAIVP